jgi:Ca2+-transporting ATPase
MVTGDHPDTARYIASQVGIGSEPVKVLTGKDLDTMDNHELQNVITSVSVLLEQLQSINIGSSRFCRR